MPSPSTDNQQSSGGTASLDIDSHGEALRDWLDNSFEASLPGLEERLYERLLLRLPKNNGPGAFGNDSEDHAVAHATPEVPQAIDVSTNIAPKSSANVRKSLHYRQSLDVFGDHRFYRVMESAWDATLIAWTPCIGWGGSLLLTTAILASMIAQLLCGVVALVALAPLGNFVNNGVQDDARMWRLKEAHNPDRMDQPDWVSLGRRVCDKDGSLVFGTLQVERLKEIESYIDPISDHIMWEPGFLLVLVCLIIFFLLMADELMNCVHFIEALVSLPRNFRKTTVINDGEHVCLVAISVWRFSVMLILVAIRVTIAVVLLVAGGQWLSQTSQLQDLLLNCAALAFVLDLDELFFKMFVPMLTKSVIEKLEAIPLSKERMFAGVGWRPLLVIIGCIVYVMVMATTIIQPMLRRMETVRTSMCSPETNTDFVVVLHENIDYAIVAITNLPPKADDAGRWNNTLLKRVTQDFSNRTNLYGQNWSSADILRAFRGNMRNDLDGLASGKYRASGRVANHADLKSLMSRPGFGLPGCTDILAEENNRTDTVLLALRFATGRHDVARCADVKDLCYLSAKIVRAYCSQTCGCRTHTSMLLLTDGCKEQCLVERAKELTYPAQEPSVNLADCTDHQTLAGTLFRQNAGQQYMHGVLSKLWKLEFLNEWMSLFKSRGCGALEELDDNYADLLCGRVPGTNVAVQTVKAMTTLRWLCPVTCGCPIDPTSCTSSCRHGAGAVANDPCLADFCLPGQRLNASRSVDMQSCGEISTRSNRSSISSSSQGDMRFQECERFRIKYAPVCCDSVT